MVDASANPEYQFFLPEELIAQQPAPRRGDARMLLVTPGVGVVGERPFRAIEELLRPGDLLVLNQSEVLPARLGTCRTETGGAVEILLIRPEGPLSWTAMARPARRLKSGVVLAVQGPDPAHEGPFLTVEKKNEDGTVVVSAAIDPGELARQYGTMPLPPYIKHHPEQEAEGRREALARHRYQTVYARPDPRGAASVAAPTAGLHFSRDTLARLAARGVKLAYLTLHVGPGTFQPPDRDQIAARRLHSEYFHLPLAVSRALAETRASGGRVIAVGTTSLRVLETVARLELESVEPHAGDTVEFGPTAQDPSPVFTGQARREGGHWEVSGQTRLFISPPDRVQAADGLVTNFHLPGSSLLMLVASLMGSDTWRGVYTHAVQERLRFYSYGDCMLILPPPGENDE